MNLRDKAATGVRWNAVNSLLTTILLLTRFAILGRLLGPEAFGLIAMVMIVGEISDVFGAMGLSDAIISEKDTTKSQLSSLYWINVIAGILFYLIVLLVSPLFVIYFSENQLQIFLPVVGLNFIISSLSIQFHTLLRKYLLFSVSVKINIGTNLLGFVVVVSLALLNFNVWSIVISQIVQNTSKTFALFYIAKKKNWLPGFQLQFNEIKNYVYFGFHRIGAMIANQLNSRMDQVVIGRMFGQLLLGYYNVAYRLVLQPIQKINPIVTQVAFPTFALLQNDDERLKRGFLKMVQLLMSINAPILVGIAAVAPMAIPILLGDKWIQAVPLVQILSFYALFRSLMNAAGSLILAKGKANWTLYWNIGLMLVVPGVVITVSQISNSLITVSIGILCLQILLVYIHYFVFLRKLLGPFFYFYFTAIFKPLIASVGMGAIVLIVQAYLPEYNHIFMLIISATIGAMLYVLLTFLIQREIFIDYFQFLPEAYKKIIIKIYTDIYEKLKL